ncbi:hypothetical protein BpHYR1_002610 [Brachionus plicatilis]|uniref:Uncharacterized protein n=1 Tax=Brachionus plicatilis TaxID=10195 RepID=A0A3M7RZK5_BRAPC|nr:hypothetical protein BpHYR1_002610 [Brachionus plicatilis]
MYLNGEFKSYFEQAITRARGPPSALALILGSCTLPGQLSMNNHVCLIGGQIFYFIVHIKSYYLFVNLYRALAPSEEFRETYMIVHGQLSGKVMLFFNIKGYFKRFYIQYENQFEIICQRI